MLYMHVIYRLIHCFMGVLVVVFVVVGVGVAVGGMF